VVRLLADVESASDGLRKLREELLGDENVLLAYVFGSYVHGFTTPLSDVDVAVLMKDNSLRNLSDLWSRLAKALKINEDLLDLVDLARAPIHLKYRVVKDGFKLIDRGCFEEKLKEELISSYPEAKRLLDSTYEEAMRTLNCKVDKELLKSRIAEILECIAGLREDILSRPREQVAASRLHKSSMERYVHVAVEAMLDVCRHIVSAKKLGIPETYKDLVKLLRDNSILPFELAARIEEYVGLRNILVHRYMVVDHERLYEEARMLVKVAEDFVNTMESLLKKEC
jgi:uncharacterized protein YutE (UPF0331/DUF86 family)/predicted nucleotidyltransferase